MLQVTCPHCASRTAFPDEEAPGRCPRCGGPLTPAEGAHPPEVEARSAPPVEGSAGGDDEALIADLREAFAHGAHALHTPDRSTMDADAHTRDAFPPPTIAAGTQFGDFEIVGELGRGGMGVVYRARQRSLNREIALKILPSYARHSRRAVQRFRSEAQAAARLHHTNIVAVYAQGEHQGQYYYAMELIDGVGLDTVIHSRPDLLSSTRARHSSSGWRLTTGSTPPAPSPSAAPPKTTDPSSMSVLRRTGEDYRFLAFLLAEVADALAGAHDAGVIHRDVKPHNMLLSAQNRLHLTDFGLARLIDEPHLTVSGEVMGTPAYLSPEQIRAHPAAITPATDVYSLGVTMYEMLTQQKPFDGENREQILDRICRDEPAAPRRLNPRIPIDLETLCLRAMEREPHKRPTAAALRDDLRRFAEGRPIRARRTSAIEKAVKWVRRHKALSIAATAILLVVVLTGGLGWSIQASRRQHGAQLLDRAYEQLAFYDYRGADAVQPDIAAAADRGAAPVRLALVRALAALGRNDNAGALDHLATVLDHDPQHVRALYLRAWALDRLGDVARGHEAFDEAERHGPPTTAEGWLFRGLAVHFVDAAEAIESYRQANRLRAAEHAFYPLAVLHLARARNQQLYAKRSLDGFADAEASLRQLIEHGYYEAYPHYLLSISHRLAAEIYRGSTGTRSDALVHEHYDAALRWARAGQVVDPNDDLPLTAEAECLESMGRFEEALAARDRALLVANAQPRRCQVYHYRWRLHYWLGHLDAAHADIAAHQSCLPDHVGYRHFYPALLEAEMGNLPAALEHARAIGDEAPNSAIATIWSASCLRLLGHSDEAQALLDKRAAAVDFALDLIPPQTPDWVAALYGQCRRGDELERLETLADESTTPWRLWGEAYFHTALRRLSDGDRPGAIQAFQRAYRSFDGELRYTYDARLLLIRLQKDLAWPPWIVVSWEQTLDGRAADVVCAANAAPCAGEGDLP